MLVECGIQVQEVGEETSGSHFACQFVKVVVAVLRQIAYATFFLPYLYREDGGGSAAYTLVSGVEQFAYHTAAFGRGVCAVVDGAEHHLIATTRMDCIHVVDESLH